MIKNTSSQVIKGFKLRYNRHILMLYILGAIALVLGMLILSLGKVIYNPVEIFKAFAGGEHDPLYFIFVELRLPRLLAAVLSGLAFGMAGVIFQTMLRNPMASPDMIGINAGASAAAVFGILVMKWSGFVLSSFALIVGLLTAVLIYWLANDHHKLFSSGRLILIGISVQAALGALTSMLLLKASQYDVQGAMRWLTGSLHTMRLEEIWPLFFIVILAGTRLQFLRKHLNILALGDQMAVSLGLQVDRVRAELMIFAVILTAFATALTGPIAFVAFLSGPLSKAMTGSGEASPFVSGLVGANIVMASDIVGQHLLVTRLPVGVITGLVGAPYLVWLIMRYHRTGGM